MALNQTPFFSDQSMAFPLLPPPLGGSEDLFMGIGENGALNFQENPQLYPNQQQVDPFSGSNNQVAPLGLPLASSTDLLSAELSQFLSFELAKQTAEMETYFQLQNQRLNTVLREETIQRGVFLQNYANKLMALIKQKESDLLFENQRNMELQQCLAITDMELKTWKNLAMEKEAVVANLSYKLKKVQERIGITTSGVPDASSTCGGDTPENEEISMESKCKLCHAENLCVLLLPCKHLCCCKSCEVKLGFCPICESLKEGSMEIYLA